MRYFEIKNSIPIVVPVSEMLHSCVCRRQTWVRWQTQQKCDGNDTFHLDTTDIHLASVTNVRRARLVVDSVLCHYWGWRVKNFTRTAKNSGAKLLTYSPSLLGTLVSDRPIGCTVCHNTYYHLSKFLLNYPLGNYYNDKRLFLISISLLDRTKSNKTMDTTYCVNHIVVKFNAM